MDTLFNLITVFSIFYVFYQGVISIFGKIKRSVFRMKGSENHAQHNDGYGSGHGEADSDSEVN